MSYELTSNPYTTIDQTMGWTLITRNALTDVTTTKTFSGSQAPAPWGTNSTVTGKTVTTAYDQSVTTCSGPATDVTDQASHTTSYCSDGLGRLVGVTDPAGNLTQHTYDLLDDLTSVTQSGQTRAFAYSSLGRMTAASNPESGTATCTASPLPTTGLETYTYDGNGDLLTGTDARSVTTKYDGYDGLNRPKTVSYTKNGTAEGTPTVTYAYDNDWKGALWSVTTSTGLSTSYRHDGFGRINGSSQTTAAAPPYTFSYTYDMADNLTQMQYPSGRKVSYVLDSAGRVNALKNVATGLPYASSIAYTPAGGMSSMALGNSVTEQRAWNDRLQFTGMTAAPEGGGTNLLGLNFYPCTGQATSCTTGNVGNIQSQNIALPGLSLTQSYTYDALNRMGTAGEGTGSWSRTYGYAEPGNQYVNPTASSGYPISAFTPTAASNFDARNRLNVNNSAYDTSGNGNQTAIGGYSFSYDAEGRIITANLGGVSSTGYVYDGDGQRVQKITCPAGTSSCTASVSGATATTFVYDAAGNLAAEYASGGAQTVCGTPTCYVSVDQIGSTRLVTDANGNVVRRYDYLPSGEEIWAGIGGRTTGMSYQSVPDGFSLKCTGAYRDPETYLDFLNARYYSPQQGRFVSPDPENAGADVTDPTTWNGYAYVSNNPLNLTDPSGQGILGFFWGLLGLISGGPIGGAIGLGLGEAADLTFNTENPLPSWAMLLICVGMTGTPLGGIGVGGDIIGDVAGGVNKRQPWNEQPPPMWGGMGPLNTGTVFGSGNTGPFIFSLDPVNGDQDGFWTVDYKGDPYWYVLTNHTTSTGLEMRAASKPSKLSVAGGCAVASVKDHFLGLGAATAAGPLPKRLLGERSIGSDWTNLVSKFLGKNSTKSAGRTVYGPGSMATNNFYRGLGRVLATGAAVIDLGLVIKTGEDAYACYSRSW